MTSQLFVRTVLIAIIAASVWALRWIWMGMIGFNDITSGGLLSLFVSSILVAALSLLIESFRSFATTSVKRGSWSYFLLDFFAFDEDRKVSSINVRTCAQFGMRSVMFAVASLVVLTCLGILVRFAKLAISFFSNPYVPSVNWQEMGVFMIVILGTVIIGLLIISVSFLIEKKITNNVVQIVVLVLFASMVMGLTMGTAAFFSPEGFGLPVYQVVLMGTGVMLGFASFFGAIFGLAYGIYRLVGKASQRFPVLNATYNQICPIRTINFK